MSQFHSAFGTVSLRTDHNRTLSAAGLILAAASHSGDLGFCGRPVKPTGVPEFVDPSLGCVFSMRIRTRPMNIRDSPCVFSLTLCALPGGCSTATKWRQPRPLHVEPSRDLTDRRGDGHRGTECSRLYEQDTRGVLLVFTSHDCPIANAYAPRIQQISDDYRHEASAAFWCTSIPARPLSSSRRTPENTASECRSCTIRQHEWVRRAEATVTPQAVLLDRQGRTVYSGRIDDQYVDFGSKRRAALSTRSGGRAGSVPGGRARSRLPERNRSGATLPTCRLRRPSPDNALLALASRRHSASRPSSPEVSTWY